jgi:MoxR-like ATPase
MSEPEYTGRGTSFYVAEPDVADTVNLAVHLRRPLLVEGEPGCGKTKLADSIAAEKGLGSPIRIAVKSTSRARDLLFRLDALRRLHDAQTPGNKDARFLYPYLSLGPLGAAIAGGERRVVLIDEIDKADIDFPNDLLDVLDAFSFQVEDLPEDEEGECRVRKGFGRTITAPEGAWPIVVITSNREKRLPEAFLRRCLYVHLRFPDAPEILMDIVRKNTQSGEEKLDVELLRKAVDSFRGVRHTAIRADAQKPPTTSELIDWVKILYWKGKTAASFDEEKPGFPPYWQTLFKTMQDLESYSTIAGAALRTTGL